MPELSVLIKVETVDALSKVLTILVVLLLYRVLLLLLQLLRLVFDREACSGLVTSLIVGDDIVLSVDVCVSVSVSRLRLVVV